VYRPFSRDQQIPHRGNEVQENLAKYATAKDAAAAELAGIVERMEKDDPEKAKIFVGTGYPFGYRAGGGDQRFISNEHVSRITQSSSI
jgi:hypothetical protein